MNNNLRFIKTKFVIPSPRKNYIKRAKLINELNNLFDYKLIVIKAPAGSGKSTLVSSFIKEKKLSNVKWINLDESNNEIYSFFSYLISALSPYLEDKTDALIQSISCMTKKEDILEIISFLVNEISSYEKPIILVFDDYHYIKEPFLNSTLERLIKYSPSNIHYIFITRESLPIYLGEMRIRNEILEVNENELKFSKKECSDFIKSTLNTPLESYDINKIYTISEGWIGGIQLTSLAFKNSKDLSIKVLNKYVVDYLTEEILKGLSNSEKDFLIKTSIMSYFNSELCNEILQIENSDEIINSLLNKNLFIITLDEEDGLFRYHHLFKEFLNTNFNKLPDSTRKQFHLNAYTSLKNSGDISEAIIHLIKIKEYQKASSELEKNIEDTSCISLIRLIPLDALINSNELIIQKIFYHYSNMQIDECKSIISYLESFKKPELTALANIFKLYVYDFCNSMTLEDLNIVKTFKLTDITKAILYLNISPAFMIQGEYEKILYYSKESDKIATKYNIVFLSVFSKCLIASVLEEQGKLSDTLKVYNDLDTLIEKNKFISGFKFLVHLGVAGVHMKKYDLENTEKFLNLSLSGLKLNYPFISRAILYNLMELYFLKGDLEKGSLTKRDLVDNYLNSHSLLPCQIHSAKLKYTLPQGNYELEELKEYKSLVEDTINMSHIYLTPEDNVVYSRVLFILGEKEKALALLDKTLKDCRHLSILIHLVEGLIVKALILKEDSKVQKRELFNVLREALHYGIESEYLRAFIVEGEKILKIIKLLQNDVDITLTKKEKNFIDKIYKLVTPIKECILSERELEVLEVLCDGNSNKEIGSILNISLSTVKTHMINIYSKLHVSNRLQAVEKAKELNLLQR
ncbi:LuxR family maltose regulon positive regulatory protein [Clostridium acetobutylicum]|uniref:Regulatory protein related to malT, positive regulator of mal regulon (ATPase and HTH-type DNA-binding domain) n=1 Tax=Clostridium acetobutylicum (strain ATCC 824 / DSM 792 / JCM 1419 / IAM 19013 / LMG 5710 / NBRC 13948 / NRRL B-527 / VKM B-1787 / 2291 / W) TaxID=272562 RepID=Q97D69_CLOAB|nr:MULTISPECIES: helix-turn-helix transcriptional regulator [Clostridium]AAK81534.1 Regulatory protein related to malT, positive regulator of mal regulon (ATPase and HTH-type DNA-binding domain) [Clostridium acetobutylicum ATCC 824]ADZ22655.1 Positive regulator of mal regulon (ATPase and HTH-type DNA-binding domain) [Clostridium acetobutylicum EA 2018]AEI34200.1 regulatory protein [Clostridium acetobutylicum DSM 1731]AWV80793.1 helix-turn-helix transcriptional regulator [Clostridium acetobutyli